MAAAWTHAVSSANKWGGEASEYLSVRPVTVRRATS